jgi:hypothetical protein
MGPQDFPGLILVLWATSVILSVCRRYFVEAILAALLWPVLIAFWLPAVQAARENPREPRQASQ